MLLFPKQFKNIRTFIGFFNLFLLDFLQSEGLRFSFFYINVSIFFSATFVEDIFFSLIYIWYHLKKQNKWKQEAVIVSNKLQCPSTVECIMKSRFKHTMEIDSPTNENKHEFIKWYSKIDRTEIIYWVNNSHGESHVFSIPYMILSQPWVRAWKRKGASLRRNYLSKHQMNFTQVAGPD